MCDGVGVRMRLIWRSLHSFSMLVPSLNPVRSLPLTSELERLFNFFRVSRVRVNRALKRGAYGESCIG